MIGMLYLHKSPTEEALPGSRDRLVDSTSGLGNVRAAGGLLGAKAFGSDSRSCSIYLVFLSITSKAESSETVYRVNIMYKQASNT